MENLGIFYDHLVYFTAIGNILLPFSIFCGHLVYFSPFWYFVPRKIWQPWWRVQHPQRSSVEHTSVLHYKKSGTAALRVPLVIERRQRLKKV
jgi:hypothetical protein